MRDAAALYNVRQAFGFWRRNELDYAGTEEEIDKLIDAIDATLDCVNRSQQAWDQAVGEVNLWIHMLEGFALVLNAPSFHAFVVEQRACLAAHGVIN
jgi:hypothetical protein